MRSRRLGEVFLATALVLGGVHAGFSLYWAAGGSWLLDTVGAEAVRMQREEPATATAVLLAAAVVKGAAAVVPVLAQRSHHARRRRVARLLAWGGGVLLVAYGTAITVVSAAVLTGALVPDGPVDRRGLRGHALLWDPLFALWGAALLAGLWCTRPRSGCDDAAGTFRHARSSGGSGISAPSAATAAELRGASSSGPAHRG